MAAEFDRANTFYGQGKFPEAVLAYDGLTVSNRAAVSVWFNLGNAAYKSGMLGRSIAAYRMAERLTPHDASLRANLAFVRSKVYSDEHARVLWWKSLLRLATLNEWAAFTALGFWLTCAALAVGELRQRRPWKTALLFATVTLLCGAALAVAREDRLPDREAIVMAREVTARTGPLDEAQSAFQLRDGAEVTVLDTKGTWLQIHDAENRTGWMRREDAFVMPDGR